MKKIFSGVLIVAVAAAVLLAAGSAEAKARKKYRPLAITQENSKYSSIVVDAANGTVLSHANADKPLHPASLTKMMTLYMTFDALKSGTLRKNQRIFVTPHAANMPPSKLDLTPRSTLRVEDAILGMVTKSANDATVAIAEAIGGSEQKFAQMMTTRARQLGMKNTTFVNASGLHNSRQISTARDMAILARALIYTFPEFYSYFSTQSFTYQGKVHRSHNKLMNSYYGMDGLKTGFVGASGYNLAASAKRNGRRLVGIVFGGRSAQTRNTHMAQLLDQGFTKVKSLGGTQVASLAPQPNPVAAYAATEQDKDIGGGEGDIDTDEDISATLKTMAQSQAGVRVTAIPRTKPPVPATAWRAPKKPIPSLVSSMTFKKFEHLDDSGWSIQIGAFLTREAGAEALIKLMAKLPFDILKGTTHQVVPLATSQGMIYRARLAGLDKTAATQACRILREHCLILAAR